MARPAARTGSAGWVYRSDSPSEVRSQKSEVRSADVEPRTVNREPRTKNRAPRTENREPRTVNRSLLDRAVLLPVALTLMTALLPVEWILRRRG